MLPLSTAHYERASSSVKIVGGAVIPAQLAMNDGPVRPAIRPENVLLGTQTGQGLGAEVIEVSHQTGTTLYTVKLAGGQEVKVRSLGLSVEQASVGQTVQVQFADCRLAFPGRA